MKCPICKNPILNPEPDCEWCGSRIDNSIQKIDDDILIIIKKNNLLKAVKLYKDRNNCSLKEAKEYIDKIRKN